MTILARAKGGAERRRRAKTRKEKIERRHAKRAQRRRHVGVVRATLEQTTRGA